jgi:hypothetical protein
VFTPHVIPPRHQVCFSDAASGSDGDPFVHPSFLSTDVDPNIHVGSSIRSSLHPSRYLRNASIKTCQAISLSQRSTELAHMHPNLSCCDRTQSSAIRSHPVSKACALCTMVSEKPCFCDSTVQISHRLRFLRSTYKRVIFYLSARQSGMAGFRGMRVFPIKELRSG